MKLLDALDQFLTAKEAANLSVATVDFYSRNVSAFVGWLEGAGVTGGDWCHPAMIERHLAAERRRGLSPHSVHARYRALRAFFGWLQERHGVPSPLAGVAKPELPDKAPRQIGPDAVDRIVDAIPTGDSATWLDMRDRLLLLLFFWTGLRLSEMAGLQVADVDVKRHLIHVQSGKGNKARYVPFVAGAGVLLLEYLVARPPVVGGALFLASDGAGGVKGQILPGGIRQMIRRRCAQAGVAYANPHSWRHGFAMMMLNSGGMEMGILSKLLGHSTTKITQDTYADWLVESLRREYDEATRAAKSRR